MGASNVSAVFTYHAALNDVAFRLLTYMALVSLDRDEPPRFWGGREDLARALGRVVPAEPAPDDGCSEAVAARKSRRNAFEAVRAGLAELKAGGVVTVAVTPKPGRRTEYLLHLPSVQVEPVPFVQGEPVPSVEMGQADPVPTEQAEPVPSAQAESVDGTGSARTTAQADPDPKEETGATGALGGEIGLSTSPPVQVLAGSRDDKGRCSIHPYNGRLTAGALCGPCRSEQLAAAV